MQTKNRFFDDFSKVANTAVSTIAGIKNEIQEIVRQQLNKHISSIDIINREEFEAVKAVAVKARIEQDELLKRIKTLETKLKKITTKK